MQKLKLMFDVVRLQGRHHEHQTFTFIVPAILNFEEGEQRGKSKKKKKAYSGMLNKYLIIQAEI